MLPLNRLKRNMTEEFDNVQRLLRLKRYEHPQDMDAYTADLIARLHIRQREDYLKQSSLQILWDRLTTWFEGRKTPAFAVAAAAVVLISLAGVNSFHSSPNSNGSEVASKIHVEPDYPKTVASPNSPLIGLEDLPSTESHEIARVLLSKHFAGDYVEDVLQTQSPERMHNRSSEPFVVMPEVQFEFGDAPSRPAEQAKPIQ